MFREVDFGGGGDADVRLADLLSSRDVLYSVDDGSEILPDHAAEVFARGRYRSLAVRSFVQCFDCDMELVSTRWVTGLLPAGLCIGLLLKGSWRAVVNDRALDALRTGVPTMLAAGEAFEASTRQCVGQRCRMAGINIGAEFFSAFADEADLSLRGFRTVLKPGCHQHELDTCGSLKYTLQRLYSNPYQGTLGHLYAESLALSAIVDLADHIEGGQRRRPALSAHQGRAYEAREILDQDLVAVPPIAELAGRIGVSEVTLRRLFKATFGITIAEYVRDRRLEAARVMLSEGRFQVGEIAYRVGYSDPANFTTAYRRRFGRPPTRDFKYFNERSVSTRESPHITR